jgi:hypothetical protein
LLDAKDAKMKPEELVTRHLDSIGTAEARGAVKNRVANAGSQFTQRLPTGGQVVGPAMIVSEAKMLRISMMFGAQDLPSEQLVFDGSKVLISQAQPGRRSATGLFFYTYDDLIREGLVGGTLTTAWALLDVPERKAKLDYNGLKKIDGKMMHELRYRPRKGVGDITISLHFDPETFRHVHTEFKMTRPADMARTPADSSAQRETVYHIQEYFEDFKQVDSLTLPHVYRITYSREGMSDTILLEYKLVVSSILHNQTLDAKAFTLQ